jgi:hypothetical protein
MFIRRTAVAISIAALTLIGVVASGPPAQASGGYWVYVSMPTWLGNCPRGGAVKKPEVTAWFGGDSSYASDFGDDLVWIRVGARIDTTIVASGLCYAGSKSWPAAGSSNTIRASRTGQTWWIGPYGTRHN